MEEETVREEAISRFRAGFNCSQSVLCSMAGKLEADASFLEKISSGFGGGMGHMQDKCGAVTGSFMAISLYCGNKYSPDSGRTERTYSLIRKFDSDFRDLHGTTVCRELIKHDLDSPGDHEKAVRENVFKDVCEKCIADSVAILFRILK